MSSHEHFPFLASDTALSKWPPNIVSLTLAHQRAPTDTHTSQNAWRHDVAACGPFNVERVAAGSPLDLFGYTLAEWLEMEKRDEEVAVERRQTRESERGRSWAEVAAGWRVPGDGSQGEAKATREGDDKGGR